MTAYLAGLVTTVCKYEVGNRYMARMVATAYMATWVTITCMARLVKTLYGEDGNDI